MKMSLSQLSENVAEKLSSESKQKLARQIWWTLIRQKQLGKLDQMLDLVRQKIAKKENIVQAVLVCASDPSEEEIQKIKTKLEKKYSKQVTLEIRIDKSLMGGFKVLVDDLTIDLSYKAKLNQLKMKLAGEQ